MTVFPDDHRDGDLHGRREGDAPDPLERLLRPPAEFLPVPPGAFEQIRRRAARRRRVRATAGGGAAVAVVAGALYLTGSLSSGGGNEQIGPPASHARTTSPAPTPTSPAPRTPTSRPTDGRPTSRPPAGGPGTATAPTAPGSGAPSPSGTGTTPMCTAGQLTPSLGGGDAGAGNLYRFLVVTNHSTTACHLAGYPGLSLLDASGRQIGEPADREPRTYQPVVLQPGGSASDTIHTANQMGSCQPASAKLRIYPPGSRASLVFAGQVTICNDEFTITPFAPGTTGNPSS
jgi:Protein of unknown function (DUF4232)